MRVLGDRVFEADETFTVPLADPQGAILGSPAAVGTIRNDDARPRTPPVAGKTRSAAIGGESLAIVGAVDGHDVPWSTLSGPQWTRRKRTR